VEVEECHVSNPCDLEHATIGSTAIELPQIQGLGSFGMC